jgi:hypothetical protein
MRAFGADADTRDNIRRAGAFEHQGADPAQRVLQAYPPLHDLHRAGHPVPKDRAELVHETFDYESGNRLVVLGLCGAHDEMVP